MTALAMLKARDKNSSAGSHSSSQSPELRGNRGSLKGSIKSSINERNSTGESPRQHSRASGDLKVGDDEQGSGKKRVKFSRPLSGKSNRSYHSHHSHQSAESYMSAAF